MIHIKRIYDEYDENDGFRVLVDRLWPRGITKEEAHLDIWLKEIAPSNDLRKWFNHDPEKWDEFQKRYKEELLNNTEIVEQLKNINKKQKKLTLLYGAKNKEYNQAVVIASLLM